jgi:hypothetical protein
MKINILSLLKSNRRDLGFITLLLCIEAVFLIGFRFLLKDVSVILMVAVVICWLGIVGYWLKPSKQLPMPRMTITKSHKSSGFFQTLGLALIFFGFSLAMFFVPMSRAFWHGADDAPLLVQNTPIALWEYDAGQNRPLAPAVGVLAEILTPGHIDSLLWLAFFLRLCTAAVISALVREIIGKSARSVAILAAILFMIDPSEPARFLAIVMANYFFASLLLWTSLWLLLRSYRLGSRRLLILSCILLEMALLTADGGYPLALIGILFLLFLGTKKPHIWVWLYAWLGALGIVALRLVIFLVTTSNPYQLTVFSENVSWLGGFIAQMKPSFAFFAVPSAAFVSQYWPYGLVGVLLAIPLLLGPATKLKLNQRFLLGLGIFVLADMLGVLLYSRFPSVLRTQFFAAPAQAVVLALLLIGLISVLPDKIKRVVLIISISATVFMVGVNTMAYQEQLFEPGIRFEYLVKAFQDLHRIAPSIKPSSLVLVVDDGPDPVMGIVDYHLPFLAWASLGVSAYRLSQNALNTGEVVFNPGGVSIGFPYIPAVMGASQECSYDHVVVFTVNYRDGSVTLLDKFPGNFLPSNVTASGYNPRARIDLTKVDPLRYMYYLPWMSTPSPRPDIYPNDAPFSLGENWYAYETGGDTHFRWANTDAEIVFTSPVPYLSQLSFDLEAGPSLGGNPLQIAFELDRGSAFATVNYKPGAPMTVTLPPNLTAGDVIKLHVLASKAVSVPNDSRTLFFCVFRISLAPVNQLSAQ